MEQQPSELVLTTGHRIVPNGSAGEPNVQIIGPNGEVQLSIRMTPAGPIVSVQAARLELSASELLSLSAPQVKISTSDGFQVQAGGAFAIDALEVIANTKNDIQLDGRTILLNCLESEEES